MNLYDNISKKSGEMVFTFPFNLYTESFIPANNTPLGDQLNLYPNGFPDDSGLGKPPHQLTNEVIRPPSLFTWSKTFLAVRWSIPGSNPSSFRIVIPADLALTKIKEE